MGTDESQLLITAGEVRDADRVRARHGAIWVRRDRSVAAAGPAEEVRRLIDRSRNEMDEPLVELNYPDSIVIPALVNVHTHLDLTHIGPQPKTDDFIAWVEMLRDRRATNESDLHASCDEGIRRSLAGGTAIVGDIAGQGSLVPARSLATSALRGVSFIEFFGHGEHAQPAVAMMRAVERVEHEYSITNRFRMGLQPHAPYSASLALYQEANAIAARSGLALATHLAETLDEVEFIESGSGRFADLIRRLGKWDDSIVAHHAHPIDYLASVLSRAPNPSSKWIAAHVNYAGSAQLDVLARADVTVAYCPRASAYFGHDGHLYQEMIRRGVRVALGTDSIVCLDTPNRISTLDEMRLLSRRDGTDADLLLRMATMNGAAGLGFDAHLVSFHPTPMERSRSIGGFIALPTDLRSAHDALAVALSSDEPFEAVMFAPSEDS